MSLIRRPALGRNRTNMSQDNLIKFKCTACKRINYYSTKNKKTLTEKLKPTKFCKWCHKHTAHAESR